jgi:hypothetical protein
MTPREPAGEGAGGRYFGPNVRAAPGTRPPAAGIALADIPLPTALRIRQHRAARTQAGDRAELLRQKPASARPRGAAWDAGPALSPHGAQRLRGRPPAAPGSSAYATAKSARIGLALSQAREFAPSGITVTTIAPGVVPVEHRADLAAAILGRRTGHPGRILDGFGRGSRTDKTRPDGPSPGTLPTTPQLDRASWHRYHERQHQIHCHLKPTPGCPRRSRRGGLLFRRGHAFISSDVSDVAVRGPPHRYRLAQAVAELALGTPNTRLSTSPMNRPRPAPATTSNGKCAPRYKRDRQTAAARAQGRTFHQPLK